MCFTMNTIEILVWFYVLHVILNTISVIVQWINTGVYVLTIASIITDYIMEVELDFDLALAFPGPRKYMHIE